MHTAIQHIEHANIFPLDMVAWSEYLRKHRLVMSLMIGLLFSAITVIYVKNMNRELVSDLQTLQDTRSDLHTQWSQLLLEESALTARARVAEVAQEKLGMVVPANREVILI
ncbi:MAG: cell division protein FtsL [Gammaproteobacteria bacterium]|nr:cell division protein FtsL [Gammaproteobacteria bacterium]